MAEVMTGALAIIYAGNPKVPIGKMKNIRVSESIRRTAVKGLGTILPSEMPATDWSGTLTCSFYMIDLTKGLPESIRRDAISTQQFIDTLLLNEKGVDVYIYKKEQLQKTNGIVTETNEKPFAIVRGLLIDRDSFDVTEGQISGQDQSFQYLEPILYNT